jgi:hypothetical protein
MNVAPATPAYEAAYKAAMFANSYTRIDVVMDAMGPVGFGPDWFRLLGEQWSVCDNLSRWRTTLRTILARASREHLNEMMTDEERSALAALPATLTIYRGCYRCNRAGLSWTLDRAVAEKFPRFMRYYRRGEQPLLLTARVPRVRAVLKLGRDEAEIIPAIARIRPLAVELLP